jgi:hypothetical protein
VRGKTPPLSMLTGDMADESTEGETWEQTGARLGIVIDAESKGSTIVSGSKAIVDALKRQAHVESEPRRGIRRAT